MQWDGAGSAVFPAANRTFIRSIWVFLAGGHFAAKAPARRCLILLYFLGFSRLNRDFSMGYTVSSGKNFSSRFVRGVGGAGRPASLLAWGKGRIIHEAKLTLISDFLQSIVVDTP
jgi:hypothetical protein